MTKNNPSYIDAFKLNIGLLQMNKENLKTKLSSSAKICKKCVYTRCYEAFKSNILTTVKHGSGGIMMSSNNLSKVQIYFDNVNNKWMFMCK